MEEALRRTAAARRRRSIAKLRSQSGRPPVTAVVTLRPAVPQRSPSQRWWTSPWPLRKGWSNRNHLSKVVSYSESPIIFQMSKCLCWHVLFVIFTARKPMSWKLMHIHIFTPCCFLHPCQICSFPKRRPFPHDFQKRHRPLPAWTLSPRVATFNQPRSDSALLLIKMYLPTHVYY